VSDSSDSGDSERDPFEREHFDAEAVADDPIGAFADDGTGVADDGSGADDDGTDSLATPGETDLTDVDVDPELRVLFWKLVLLYKVTIIGATLGLLLLVFEKGPGVGPELLGGSLVLLGYTLYRTKRGKERIDAGEFDDENDESSSDTAGAIAASRQGGET
jgi:hypothetical protein